jgi:hypothetical protein
MYSVMLPRNPLPVSFPHLLDAFRSSQWIHRLIELNLVAGANFALGWTRKWHPRLYYSSMSLSFPPGGASLQVHLEATLQPARRIITRLLREDVAFFREHHYLDPLGVDDSDNPILWCSCMYFVYGTWEFLFSNFFCQKFLFSERFILWVLVRLPQFLFEDA